MPASPIRKLVPYAEAAKKRGIKLIIASVLALRPVLERDYMPRILHIIVSN